MAAKEPATLAALKEGLAAGRVGLIGGEASEDRLPLLSHESILAELQRGLASYEDAARPPPEDLRPLAIRPDAAPARHPAQARLQGRAARRLRRRQNARRPAVQGPLGRARRQRDRRHRPHAARRQPSRRRFSPSPRSWASRWTPTTWRRSAWPTGPARPAPGSTTCGGSPATARPSASGSPSMSTFAKTDQPGQLDRFEADRYRSPYLKQAIIRKQDDPISTPVRYWQQQAAAGAAEAMETLAALVTGKGQGRQASGGRAADDRSQPRHTPRRRPDRRQSLRPHAARLDPQPAAASSAASASRDSASAACRRSSGPSMPPMSTPAASTPSSMSRRLASCISRPASPLPRDKKTLLLLAEDNVLRNEFFEAIINPTTGSLAAIHEYKSRGNRLSQQLALRMPGPKQKPGDTYRDPDEAAVYSVDGRRFASKRRSPRTHARRNRHPRPAARSERQQARRLHADLSPVARQPRAARGGRARPGRGAEGRSVEFVLLLPLRLGRRNGGAVPHRQRNPAAADREAVRVAALRRHRQREARARRSSPAA